MDRLQQLSKPVWKAHAKACAKPQAEQRGTQNRAPKPSKAPHFSGKPMPTTKNPNVKQTKEEEVVEKQKKEAEVVETQKKEEEVVEKQQTEEEVYSSQAQRSVL